MSFLDSVQPYLHGYGSAAVALAILLEDFGIPVPGETMLISGAILASKGSLRIEWLLPLAWAGAVIGDNIGFAIGHFGGHRLVVRYGSRFGITAERLGKVEQLFQRYGDYVVIFARFVVLARQLNGIVAGTLEMHWARFLLFNAIGAALWVGFWGLLSYWLGRSISLTDLAHAGWAGAGIVVLAILAAGYYFWRRRRVRRGANSEG